MSRRTVLYVVLSVVVLSSLLLNGSSTSASPRAQAIPQALGEVEITWDAGTNTPTFLRGHMPLPVSIQSAQADVAGAALAFVEQYRALFGVTSVQNELLTVQSQVDELGLQHVTLQQIHQGVEVYNALMKVHMNLTAGEVIAASSGFVPNITLPSVEPQIGITTAVQFAQSLLPGGMLQGRPTLVVYPGSGSGRAATAARLVWLVELSDEAVPARNIYVVDAINSEWVDVIERIHAADLPIVEQEPEPDDVVSAQVQTPTETDIVGGTEVTNTNLYPWMAIVYSDFDLSDDKVGLCGGSLIHPRWVLTAAHCVVDEHTGATVDKANVQVILGRLRRSANDGDVIGVTEVITHTSYNRSTNDFDIALLHLNAASSQATLPGLANSNNLAQFAPDELATAIGWGSTRSFASATDELRQVSLPLVADSTCRIAHPLSNIANILCAGYLQGGKDTCQGDSGGPLIVRDRNGRWLQVGIVSWGFLCAAPLSYGVYTRVPQFKDWVKSQLTDEACNAVNEIPTSECQTLVLFYESTNGSNWVNDDKWLATNTPCTWHGVTCSNGHITGIGLESNELKGALPPELGNLPLLEKLDLDNNQLSGVIPAELSQLANLKTLSLFGNQLRGEIPGILGNLAHLQLLDLSNNQVTGTIHPALGRLTQLQTLLLNKNNLNGSIPPELGNLPNLGWLALSENQLSGNLPTALGNLTNLVTLNLSKNKLNGRIPVELNKLVKLQNLYLGQNQLQESIPPELGDLPALKQLYLQSNQLRGPLPQNLTKLSLTAFWYSNTQVCEPQDNAMQTWLASIPELNKTGVNCAIVGQAKRYSTYSAEQQTQLPGTLLRIDDQPAVGDLDVDHAHEFAVSVHLYYTDTHKRSSYDNKGALIISTANYGRNYNNAFWNGEQMVYGDGFSVRDVVAHELTHAVTEHSANLEYRWQSGALNESFSDIFGAMVDRDDWLMGEDLPPDALGGREAIRDLADPARFGQPAHTKDWVATCADNEGVHTNSGIFNKAFYNIATAAAVGKDKSEKIFYRALTIYLQPTSSFNDARAKVLQSTEDLYGKNTAEYNAVVKGFNDVGINGSWNPSANECTCGAIIATANETDSASLLTNLRAVRDQVFTQDPGRRWTRIYYDHQFEVAWRLVSNSEVRADATAGIRAFDPVLRALLGEETEEPVLLTPELIAVADRALLGIANISSTAVHDDIVREWAQVNPQRFVGWDVRTVWEYLRQEEQTQQQIYLPLIEK